MMHNLSKPLFALPLLASLVAVSQLFFSDSWIPLGIVVIFSLLSIYHTYLTKKLKYWGIPILYAFLILFMFHTYTNEGTQKIGFTVISLAMAIFLAGYTLASHSSHFYTIIALSILSAALLVHMIPALTPFLMEVDTYWFYRFAKYVVDTGNILTWDSQTYTPLGHTLDGARFLWTGVMGYAAMTLQPLGISLYDVAMTLPGINAAFTILLMLILIKYTFEDKSTWKYAAIFAGFLLIFSGAFGGRAIASDCEDDGFGMLLMVASFTTFIMSVRKKSMPMSAIAGFVLLLHNMSWTGYEFGIMSICNFTILYSLIQFFHKQNPLEHVKYLILPAVFDSIAPFFMWTSLEDKIMRTIELTNVKVFILFSAGLALLLYFIQQKNKKMLAGFGVVAAILLIIFSGDIYDLSNSLYSRIFGLKSTEILDLTTSEQASACSGGVIDCLKAGYTMQSVPFIYGLIAILLLGYDALKNRNMGAVFVLVIGLPMMWGTMQSIYFGFVASMSIILLGSSLALYLPEKKEDWNSLKILTVLILFVTPVVTVPMIGNKDYFNYPSSQVIHQGPMSDRYYWDESLNWFKNNTDPKNTLVLTWWDYGNWFTSVAERRSLLDNTKSKKFMVQDVATWHVVETNEDIARDIACCYNATHAVIDFTMISKSGAPHVISTSGLENKTVGSWMGYGQCSFSKEYSKLGISITPTDTGVTTGKKIITFVCSNYIGAVQFEIVDNKFSADSTYIYTMQGDKVPLNTFMDANKIAILGVQPLSDILGDILQNPDANRMPTYRTLVVAAQATDNDVTYDMREAMMTKTYLGDYAYTYAAAGLCKQEWCFQSPNHLKYFKLIPAFADGSLESHGGFVRAYTIDCSGYDGNTQNCRGIST